MKFIENSKKHYVYRLMSSNECVYVGITKDIKRRIRQHWLDKEFDEYVITGLYPFELARAIERRDILKLKPKYNKEIIGYRSIKNVCNDLKRDVGYCSVEEVLHLIDILEIDVVDIDGRKLVRVEDGRIIRNVYKEIDGFKE